MQAPARQKLGTEERAPTRAITTRAGSPAERPRASLWQSPSTPVVLAATAVMLLCVIGSRLGVLWGFFLGLLGISLLGTVVYREAIQFQTREESLSAERARVGQITLLLTQINAGGNVGSSLTSALAALRVALNADAGCIWLCTMDGEERLSLVEQQGFPAAEDAEALIPRIQRVMARCDDDVAGHQETIRAGSDELRAVHCITVRLGSERDHFGFMMLARADREFVELDRSVLNAVGSSIGGALRNIRMVSEVRKMVDRDPITGLLNHRSIHLRLNAELERSTLEERPFAVLKMDLDNFKLFNDTYGHTAGDDVLKRVSAVLKRTCRESDVVARYGGDEFMVLLPDTNVRQALRCAERIQAGLARERFRCQDSASLPIGFSYGIATFPEDGAEIPVLVSVADTHLLQSRSEGGNRITARGATRTDSTLIYARGFDLFRAMITAVDNKDGYTRRHSEEVTEYSMEIARELALGEEMLQAIQLSGILHDVGKIGVPDEILRKPGHLTEEEFSIMAQHPVFGALIVGALPGMEVVVLGVRHHHERWDGRGYPDRLAGEEIPQIGRIMAVADAYSAMTTSRPYRKGMPDRQALGEIERGLGTQFDPEVGRVFLNIRRAAIEAATAATDRKRSSSGKSRPPLAETSA